MENLPTATSPARKVADVSLQTSPEKPESLYSINDKIAKWIGRLGEVWVEGQITQINARTGANQAYIGLRDLERNASAQVVTSQNVLATVPSKKATASSC